MKKGVTVYQVFDAMGGGSGFYPRKGIALHEARLLRKSYLDDSEPGAAEDVTIDRLTLVGGLRPREYACLLLNGEKYVVSRERIDG